MREVRPIIDEHEKEALSARCGVRYKRSMIMYAAFEKEIPLAFSCFQYSDHIADFYVVASTDESKNDPLASMRLALLGALTFALQGGCERFHFNKNFPKGLLESMGLHQTDKGFYKFW